MTLIRISKILSEQGVCSRREADRYIEQGFVYVDGQQVTELGAKAYPHQKVELKHQGKKIQDSKKTILLNKPVGYISHADDEKKYQSALTLIKPENYFGQEKMTNSYFKIAPAGRLDIDSTGLLVLTEDGVIAKQIIQEDSEIEKEYIVRVQGQLIENGLQLLNFGLFLDNKALKKADVSWLNKDQLKFILNSASAAASVSRDVCLVLRRRGQGSEAKDDRHNHGRLAGARARERARDGA